MNFRFDLILRKRIRVHLKNIAFVNLHRELKRNSYSICSIKFFLHDIQIIDIKQNGTRLLSRRAPTFRRGCKHLREGRLQIASRRGASLGP